MRETIVDFPKVAQMLDSGWEIECFKNQLDTYTVRAFHPNVHRRNHTADALKAFFRKHCVIEGLEYRREQDWEGDKLETDDATPEQALTRIAYKTFGEVI